MLLAISTYSITYTNLSLGYTLSQVQELTLQVAKVEAELHKVLGQLQREREQRQAANAAAEAAQKLNASKMFTPTHGDRADSDSDSMMCEYIVEQ